MKALPDAPPLSYMLSGPDLDSAVAAIAGYLAPFSSDIAEAWKLWDQMHKVEQCAMVLHRPFPNATRYFECILVFRQDKQTDEQTVRGHSDSEEGSIAACYVMLNKGRNDLFDKKKPVIAREKTVIGVVDIGGGRQLQLIGDGPKNPIDSKSAQEEYDSFGADPPKGE